MTSPILAAPRCAGGARRIARVGSAAVLAILVFLPSARTAARQTADHQAAYETLFYTHDSLRLEAYLYTPSGNGPFPMVVYNHGSAPPGEERVEWPAPFVARLLVPAGYALLVPERRGYGKSEGEPFSAEIGQERGPRFVARQHAEAGDINAAVEHVLNRPGPPIDPKRVAIMGWSFGGIVTTLAASRSARYFAAVIQAPGALNWDRSEDFRKALIEAAGQIRIPTYCAVAENDATTESARAVCAAVSANGGQAVLKVSPPFDSGRQRPGTPAGHAMFGPSGVALWEHDVLTFLADAANGARR